MLKNIALIGLVVLTGCAQPVYYSTPHPVYIEQQIYTPTRHQQCSVYIAREQNCYNLGYPDLRANCIADSRSHYRSCMTR